LAESWPARLALSPQSGQFLLDRFQPPVQLIGPVLFLFGPQFRFLGLLPGLVRGTLDIRRQ
jgi:hypothetical protein